MTTIETVAERLRKMSAGQRAWFSLCSSLSIDKPRLLIQFLRDDPDSNKVAAEQRALSSEPFTMGMVSLNADGRLQFLGSSLERSHLDSLAEWVSENVQAHASLASLKHCVLNQVSPTGLILAQHEDSSLWKNIPEHLAPYTVQESLYRLQKLKTNKQYWFWLTNKGPIGAPYFYLYPNQKSDSLRKLQKHILHIRKLLDSEAKSYSGAITREAKELLTLISFDSAKALFQSLAELYQQDKQFFAELEKVRIVQNSKDSLSEIYRIAEASETKNKAESSPEISALSGPLQKLQAGKKLYFWFDSNNFILSADKVELREKAKQIGTKGIRGETRLSSKGFVVFQTKQTAPSFMLDLVKWTNQNKRYCAELSVLKHSRMIQRDEEGNVLDKQKADSSWL